MSSLVKKDIDPDTYKELYRDVKSKYLTELEEKWSPTRF